jgi:hypothetical protein
VDSSRQNALLDVIGQFADSYEGKRSNLDEVGEFLSAQDISSLRLAHPRLANAIREHKKIDAILAIFEANFFPEIVAKKQSLFKLVGFLVVPLQNAIESQKTFKSVTGKVKNIKSHWDRLIIDDETDPMQQKTGFLKVIKERYDKACQPVLNAAQGCSGALRARKMSSLEKFICPSFDVLEIS